MVEQDSRLECRASSQSGRPDPHPGSSPPTAALSCLPSIPPAWALSLRRTWFVHMGAASCCQTSVVCAVLALGQLLQRPPAPVGDTAGLYKAGGGSLGPEALGAGSLARTSSEGC